MHGITLLAFIFHVYKLKCQLFSTENYSRSHGSTIIIIQSSLDISGVTLFSRWLIWSGETGPYSAKQRHAWCNWYISFTTAGLMFVRSIFKSIQDIFSMLHAAPYCSYDWLVWQNWLQSLDQLEEGGNGDLLSTAHAQFLLLLQKQNVYYNI